MKNMEIFRMIIDKYLKINQLSDGKAQYAGIS